MNQHIITVNPGKVNFSPATVLEEIFQNVNTIVTTTLYSVPLFRGFGIEATFLDEPIPVSKAIQIAEIIEKVERFEKRVIVEEVRFDSTPIDGSMTPIITIRIRNGVKL